MNEIRIIYLVYENEECQQLNKSDLEQSSVNISCDSIPYVASENTNTTDNDFKDTLAVWTTEHQVSHIALRTLLQILKLFLFYEIVDRCTITSKNTSTTRDRHSNTGNILLD